jgi:hypothetical protein
LALATPDSLFAADFPGSDRHAPPDQLDRRLDCHPLSRRQPVTAGGASADYSGPYTAEEGVDEFDYAWSRHR